MLCLGPSSIRDDGPRSAPAQKKDTTPWQFARAFLYADKAYALFTFLLFYAIITTYVSMRLPVRSVILTTTP